MRKLFGGLRNMPYLCNVLISKDIKKYGSNEQKLQ